MASERNCSKGGNFERGKQTTKDGKGKRQETKPKNTNRGEKRRETVAKGNYVTCQDELRAKAIMGGEGLQQFLKKQ